MNQQWQIKNHATANGYHFYTSIKEDGRFHIECVDDWAYSYGQYRCDVKDQLFKTLDEAIKHFGSSRRETVLPDGSVVIPEAVNYPNRAINDVFKVWHHNVRELWPGEYEGRKAYC